MFNGMRWGAAILIFGFGIAIVLGNIVLPVIASRRGTAFTIVPFVGGITATCALFIAPAQLGVVSILPMLVDPGCLIPIFVALHAILKLPRRRSEEFTDDRSH